MLKTKQIIKPVILACSAGLLLTACATYQDDGGYAATTTTDGTVREASGSQWQAGAGTRSQQQYGTTQQQYGTTQQYSARQQQYGTTQQQQQYGQQAGQSQQLQGGEQWIIPLHEEQVNVGKRTVDAGTVTIRKIVTTETVSQPVQLRRETLVIDREGAGGQFQGTAAAGQQGFQAQGQFQAEPAGAQRGTQQGQVGGRAFQEQTYTIQLREEQPMVEKNVVQTGQVVARKQTQTQSQNVQREVRREDVRLDQGANARNVEIRGNFDTGRRIDDPAGAEQPRVQQQGQWDQQQDQQRSTIYQSETEIETQRSGELRGDQFQYQDRRTLDDIDQGSRTRGGASGLQPFSDRP